MKSCTCTWVVQGATGSGIDTVVWFLRDVILYGMVRSEY